MDLEGRTAVITGGASGMGRAMALRFAAAGCNVVVADIEVPPLDTVVAEIEATGAEAIGVPTDVRDHAAMEALAQTTRERFGPADLVCLNAGVAAGGELSRVTLADWEWVLGVNLWGVINGLQVFLPDLEARDEGHIVITASVAGVLSYPLMGPYNASKHAVLSIAETLFNELQQRAPGVGVTALCPGLVNTNILDSERNRPEDVTAPALRQRERSREEREFVEELYKLALAPEAVADMVHDAVAEGRFYVFTDDVFDEAIALRHRQIEERSNPQLRGHLVEEQLWSQEKTK